MRIVPAILTENAVDFARQIERASLYFDRIQIDVQDGIAVPSHTLPLTQICGSLISLPETVLKKCTFDFHLMVSDHDAAFSLLQSLKSTIALGLIFVHISVQNSQNAEGLTLCPVLNPEDPIGPSLVFAGHDVSTCTAMQIMTIAPGPQGQTFTSSHLEKIHHLRTNHHYTGEVLVDGGINPESIKRILTLPASYHPDTLCVGSYLSHALDADFESRVLHLEALIARV